MLKALAINRRSDEDEIRWKPMLGVSLLLHGLLFSSLFWVPGSGSISGLRMSDVVYEVSLVEGTPGSISEDKASAAEKASSAMPENREAKRIYKPSSKKNAVTIAKRTVEKKKSRPAQDSNKYLEKAIANIKKRAGSQNAENADHLEKAIAAIGKKAGATGGSSSAGASGGGTSTGGSPALRIYQMEVEILIKSNWAFPDAQTNRKDIEAIVLLKVKNDGTVLDTDFIKPSGNDIFDQTVLKAIEKSKPLPPLPEGHNKRNEELEINFNLRDLE